MKGFDIIFHPLYQVGLILPYGAPDVGPHEQGVETGEDAKHLVCIFGSSQLVAEVGGNPRFHSINAFFVSLNGRIPSVLTFLGYVQAVHFFDIFVCQVHLLKISRNSIIKKICDRNQDR